MGFKTLIRVILLTFGSILFGMLLVKTGAAEVPRTPKLRLECVYGQTHVDVVADRVARTVTHQGPEGMPYKSEFMAVDTEFAALTYMYVAVDPKGQAWMAAVVISLDTGQAQLRLQSMVKATDVQRAKGQCHIKS